MEDITKEEFEAYVKVQESGVTNMMMLSIVSGLTGLSREKIKCIMQNYEALHNKYMGVAK